MTDNEIIRALECCGTTRLREQEGDKSPCTDCPMQICEDCEAELPDYALDLINRQKAEIAELKSEISILTDANENLQDLYREEQAKVETAKQKVIDAFKKLNTAKSEAIREFAERLKNLIYPQLSISTYEKGEAFHFCLDEIDSLVKEMTEERKGDEGDV